MESTTQENARRITSEFEKNFGTSPEFILRSPGRINLIGEHTDYNMGFVVPSAIDKSIYFGFRRNGTNMHRLFAMDKGEKVDVHLTQFEKQGFFWAHFLQGGLWQLHAQGNDVEGVDLVFGSDLPIGAGLSSSSALSCGFLEGLNQLFGFGISRFDIAMMGHHAERKFVGLKGGIMDQFANMLSKPDHFILLDCRSREYTFHKLALDQHSLVLINTCVSHKLTDSDYNVRAEESARAAEVIRSHFPEVKSLRDVNLKMIDEMKPMLGEILAKRASFVVKENQRVMETIEACHRMDFERVGKNLLGSHVGLRDEYEVSCTELDFLVDQAIAHEGVLGARMMGGGFGGCTINLVENEKLDAFTSHASEQYREAFQIDAEVISVRLTGGSEVL